MKKLFKFFIIVYLINCLSFQALIAKAILYSRKPYPRTSIKLNKYLDSSKLHSAKSKDLKNLKSSFVFLTPKTSFHTIYLYTTLHSQGVAFHKMDTASIPLNNIIPTIQVTNPIHDAMTLQYALVQENFVTAKIFSVLGNEVTTLFSEKQNPGIQIKTFNISDRVSSGIYILRLTVGSQRVAKRIQVL